MLGRRVAGIAAVAVVAGALTATVGGVAGGGARGPVVDAGGGPAAAPPAVAGTVTGTVTAPVAAGGTATVPVTCSSSALRYEATFVGADLGGATVGATVTVAPFKGPGTWPGSGTVTVAAAGGPTLTVPVNAPVTVGADGAAQVSVSTTVGGTPVALTLAWSCTSVWPSY